MFLTNNLQCFPHVSFPRLSNVVVTLMAWGSMPFTFSRRYIYEAYGTQSAECGKSHEHSRPFSSAVSTRGRIEPAFFQQGGP